MKNLSDKQGKKMNSPESAKDIPKFLELFKVQSVTKPFFYLILDEEHAQLQMIYKPNEP